MDIQQQKISLLKWCLVTVSIGLAILILGGISLPCCGGIRPNDKKTKVLANGKTLGLACKLYAGDHDGNFPATLEELIPKYLPDEKWLHYPSRDGKQILSWQYLGGKDTDTGSNILLKTDPDWNPDYQVVIHVDQSGLIERKQ